MDRNELERYQVQLSQVELALASDPDNAELASLRSELKELIDLTTSALEAQEKQQGSSKGESSRKASSSQASAAAYNADNWRTWAAGDECLAKYSGDGQWYPARITSTGGSTDNRVYSVMFRGYNNTELLTGNEIKALPPSYQGASLSKNGGSTAVKRKFGLTKEEEAEKEKKKKKNEKKMEVRAAKAKEQSEKQASWQKFAKKSERKGIHIAGVAGTSIFKTPDNPLGKGEVVLSCHRLLFVNFHTSFYAVGVTGSGKGMTEVTYKPKNKFSFSKEDSTA